MEAKEMLFVSEQRYEMETKEIYDVSSLATVQSAFIRLVLHAIR